MYIRKKDKIEKYIESLIKKYGNCSFIGGTQSRYYYIGSKCLRISDHIGANSSGHVSIIIPQHKEAENQYIIHGHSSGQISVIDYEKVKELVRSFFYLSSIFSDVTPNRTDVNKECDEQKKSIQQFNQALKNIENLEFYKGKASDKTIMGVPLSYFSEGQIKSINDMANKIIKSHQELQNNGKEEK